MKLARGVTLPPGADRRRPRLTLGGGTRNILSFCPGPAAAG